MPAPGGPQYLILTVCDAVHLHLSQWLQQLNSIISLLGLPKVSVEHIWRSGGVSEC